MSTKKPAEVAVGDCLKLGDIWIEASQEDATAFGVFLLLTFALFLLRFAMR